jgi:hypothetical protein
VLADGLHHIGARSFDGANYSGEETVAVTVDNTVPSVRIDDPLAGTFVGSSFSAAWTAWDPGSGIDHIRIQLDADPPLIVPSSVTSHSFTNAPEGPHTLSIRAFDRAGNERQALLTFAVDATSPTTKVTVYGTAGQAGWFTSGVTVLLSAADSLAGVKTTFAQADTNVSSGAAIYPQIVIRDDGVHTLSYRATDVVGNVEATHTLQISIDATPPKLEISPHPSFLRQGDVIISWTGTDATSGIARYEVSVDADVYRSVGLSTSSPFLLSDGEHTIHIRAIDAAGLQTNRSAHVTVDSNVFSLTGPYGGAPTIAIPAVIAVVAVVLFFRRRGGRGPNRKTDDGPST